MNLLTKSEAEITLGVNGTSLSFFMKEGMPYLKIGNEFRFIENEMIAWYKDYLPKQEKLEREFIDAHGRKIDEYSSLEETISFLRIKKEKIYRLCRNGMPFEKIGKKRFFHLGDIISYFRKGTDILAETRDEISISFLEIKDGYSWFNVTRKRKRKIMKHYDQNPISAALLMANNLAHQETEKIPIRINKIPKFDEYANGILNGKYLRKAWEQLKEKMIFSTENSLDFLKADKTVVKKEEVIHSSAPIFIVDGSYRDTDDKSGAGVIEKVGNQITGYSFAVSGKTSTNAEFTAIYKALKIAFEKKYPKLIIATDQQDFLNAIKRYKKTVPEDIWKKNMQNEQHFAEFYTLYNQMKDKVQFVYYKHLGKDKTTNYELYKKLYESAHHFSRVYQNTMIDGMENFGEHLTKVKKKPIMTINEFLERNKKEKQISNFVVDRTYQGTEKIVELNNQLKQNGKEKTLLIKFSHNEDGMPRFQVSIDGKTKTTKMNTSNTVHAALLLASNYVGTYENLKVKIEKIPSFELDMIQLFDPRKEKTPRITYRLIKKLEEECDFQMEDWYSPYLKNYEKNTIVA